MKKQITGTIVAGTLQLDRAIDLPSDIRVNVTIEPIPQTRADRIAAWEAMKRRNRERPIHFGGHHFTRDELHDRD